MKEQNNYQKMIESQQRTEVQAAPIKAEMRQFFALIGIQARPICRVAPARFGDSFGGNCPHNFLRRSPQSGHITIYLEFKSAEIHLGNFNRIIAIADVDAATLPRHPRGNSKHEKVNLTLLPDRYIFCDWDDLKANYRRILALH